MTRISKRHDSEFSEYMFVIDPPGCGCTDCQLGYSTPMDELKVEQLAEAKRLGMHLINRSKPIQVFSAKIGDEYHQLDFTDPGGRELIDALIFLLNPAPDWDRPRRGLL